MAPGSGKSNVISLFCLIATAAVHMEVKKLLREAMMVATPTVKQNVGEKEHLDVSPDEADVHKEVQKNLDNILLHRRSKIKGSTLTKMEKIFIFLNVGW